MKALDMAEKGTLPVRLSIVIPCYNAQAYIPLCLENLEKQVYRNWEAIFVDDGSKDDTGRLLDGIKKNKKYKVIHKENCGTASARNRGMEEAQGEYITFLDVDDELDAHIYERLVHMMDETNADIGICGFFFKVEKETKGGTQASYLEKKSYPTSFYKTKEEIREHLVDMWDSDILSNVWNKIYRMDLIKEKGLFYRNGHVYTEDRVFNRQFIENCSSMALTEECLYYYVRERVGSTTEKYREDYFLIRYREYHEFQEHFKTLRVWNRKAEEYVSREFIERISGCIENLFHVEGKRKAGDIKARISEIIHHEDVIEAARKAECKSRKMKILVWPIKRGDVQAAYLLYKLVYQIRKSNPALFHKLKNRR